MTLGKFELQAIVRVPRDVCYNAAVADVPAQLRGGDEVVNARAGPLLARDAVRRLVNDGSQSPNP